MKRSDAKVPIKKREKESETKNKSDPKPDHELFIQAYESKFNVVLNELEFCYFFVFIEQSFVLEPTQIYKFLRTRFKHSVSICWTLTRFCCTRKYYYFVTVFRSHIFCIETYRT